VRGAAGWLLRRRRAELPGSPSPPPGRPRPATASPARRTASSWSP